LEALVFRRNVLDILEKFCGVCKRKNEREAMVCVHCGASLEANEIGTSEISSTAEVQTIVLGRMGELLANETLIPDGNIAMYLAGTSDPIFVSSENEFVIGRKVGEETPESFLDLAKWGGYQLGLSKRHLTIRRVENAYEAIDLSSSNGTWLNDEQLLPHKPYPLASGSQLRLAKMRLIVLYRPAVGAKQ
jgi:pSer/pThr/pTyr-binding forkhead associated (FHA) protein